MLDTIADRLGHLRSLSLTSLGNLSYSNASTIARLTHLTTLTLSAGSFQPGALVPLGRLVPSLACLRLASASPSDEVFTHDEAAAILRMPGLTRLDSSLGLPPGHAWSCWRHGRHNSACAAWRCPCHRAPAPDCLGLCSR